MSEIAERLVEIGRMESITIESFAPIAQTGRRRGGLLAVGLVLVLLAAGVVGFAVIKGEKGEGGSDAGKPDAQVIPGVPELTGIDFDLGKVAVTLDTTPPGAAVFEPGNEKPLGVTPLSLTFKRAEQNKIFEIRLAGYKPVKQEVSLLDDTRVMVNMAKEAKPPRIFHRKRRRKKIVKTPDAGTAKPPDRGGTIDPFKDM